ncbi:hypothetical protein STCU_10747 [Strigomonas culicis]|uniref:Uncharacterized protein n=1 Tax=Strigomonas culicis TaxID=28005 RepID=S9URL3_9TRYP|nr:hypothetical protein STCU_10747 [Strigomonas culicis]|eukprot:EPY17231.1 hypothetical protein STCU_10747 [Strigomonas culicis]
MGGEGAGAQQPEDGEGQDALCGEVGGVGGAALLQGDAQQQQLARRLALAEGVIVQEGGRDDVDQQRRKQANRREVRRPRRRVARRPHRLQPVPPLHQREKTFLMRVGQRGVDVFPSDNAICVEVAVQFIALEKEETTLSPGVVNQRRDFVRIGHWLLQREELHRRGSNTRRRPDVPVDKVREQLGDCRHLLPIKGNAAAIGQVGAKEIREYDLARAVRPTERVVVSAARELGLLQQEGAERVQHVLHGSDTRAPERVLKGAHHVHKGSLGCTCRGGGRRQPHLRVGRRAELAQEQLVATAHIDAVSPFRHLLDLREGKQQEDQIGIRQSAAGTGAYFGDERYTACFADEHLRTVLLRFGRCSIHRNRCAGTLRVADPRHQRRCLVVGFKEDVGRGVRPTHTNGRGGMVRDFLEGARRRSGRAALTVVSQRVHHGEHAPHTSLLQRPDKRRPAALCVADNGHREAPGRCAFLFYFLCLTHTVAAHHGLFRGTRRGVRTP